VTKESIMSEDPTEAAEPVAVPAPPPVRETNAHETTAQQAAVAPSALNRIRWASPWHYVIALLIGIVLGALICGGLLGIADHFRDHRGGPPGQFRRTGPGISRVNPGPGPFGNGRTQVRPGQPGPAAPAVPPSPTPTS
jgi:hypothetical protein